MSLKLKVQTCWYTRFCFFCLFITLKEHTNLYSLFVSFSKEQLDGAGIELPKLYEMIESQAPNGCYTEAWKKRSHWVGTQVTKETGESLAKAESFLLTHRPVRK